MVQARSRTFLWTAFPCWLLSFPNAPYLATDLVHLGSRGDALWWGDVLLLAFFAGLGCLLACLSLFRIHGWLGWRLSGRATWLVLACICLLTGLGMYLGRFLRWSSWDVFRDPLVLFGGLAERALAPWEHPRMLAFTLSWSLLLFAGYGMIFTLVRFGWRNGPPAGRGAY